MGYAHSIEARENGTLVGGLYGVAMGGVFFGESMFSVIRDASKIALVHLVALFRLSGFRLLDTQFVTPHLAQFGVVEMPRTEYKNQLAAALESPALWHEPGRQAVLLKSAAWQIAREDRADTCFAGSARAGVGAGSSCRPPHP